MVLDLHLELGQIKRFRVYDESSTIQSLLSFHLVTNLQSAITIHNLKFNQQSPIASPIACLLLSFSGFSALTISILCDSFRDITSHKSLKTSNQSFLSSCGMAVLFMMLGLVVLPTRWHKFCLHCHIHFHSWECFLAFFSNSSMAYLVAH